MTAHVSHTEASLEKLPESMLRYYFGSCWMSLDARGNMVGELSASPGHGTVSRFFIIMSCHISFGAKISSVFKAVKTLPSSITILYKYRCQEPESEMLYILFIHCAREIHQ
jgi:hypothetical protein